MKRMALLSIFGLAAGMLAPQAPEEPPRVPVGTEWPHQRPGERAAIGATA